LTSGRGRAKVILVFPADAMNHASANALLTTLEEPAGSLRFVLATAAPHALLPTIRSRCQAMALMPPTDVQARAWLQVQLPDLPEEQRQAALKACGGRPMDALAWAQGGTLAFWADLPKSIQKGQVGKLSGWTAVELLDALQKLCHDLWAVKLGAAPRFFEAQDLPKPPPARALAAWSQQLKSNSRVIDHPFKPDLLLEDLADQAKLCINSRS
jgi:DNA polymerase III subunit delta'